MKVLVVDDDPGSLLVAKAAVERSGHQCLTAPDGDAAWTLYQRQRPHAVVTDLMMPGLDGIALCKAIRAGETDSYTYVILLTSHGARDDVLAGIDAGADDYVAKPLDPFTLHTRLIVADRVTSLHRELAGYRRALAEQARTDPLTGLRNRLTLAEDLQALHARAQRYETAYCLAMCDVDNFKSYNDTYGHQAGDAALKAAAAAMAGQLRESDGIYRYGGEEFLLLLPGQTRPGAKKVMERVRKAVQDLGIIHPGSDAGVLTISAGISSYQSDQDIGSEELLSDADRALFTAKAAGRNIVTIAEPIRSQMVSTTTGSKPT
ncbi:diguanylate cyclase [bacterium RCC_150]